MKRFVVFMLVLMCGGLRGQVTVGLPAVVVHSPRIANQSPVATFAAPVSSLRYEPMVDVQTRNMAEGQADITVRGSTFENTGFRIGAVTILDPQTGHYLAELPVPPMMLTAPRVLTGVANTLGSMNVNVGSIVFDWRPVGQAGVIELGVGEYGLNRQELYQGVAASMRGGAVVGADVEYAHSASDGAVPYGDHHFQRIGGRLQWRSGHAQTDLFAGYQAKFFGWPNLYTPYGVNESENLQTLLLAVNHRTERDDQGYFEAGAYYRRNKDDYEFNRLVPGLYNPYQHTTWLRGAALAGREAVNAWAVRYRAEVAADELQSTSLTAGRYHSRTIAKIALAGEHAWAADAKGQWQALAGLTYDDTNRDNGAFSPLAEISRRFRTGGRLQTIKLGYARTTQVPSYTALNSAAGSGLFRGNPDLGRESSRNLELCATGTLLGWQIQAMAFQRWDDALVDWTYQTGVLARTANPVDAVTRGIEFVGRRDYGWSSATLGYTLLSKDADYGSAAVDASFYALNYARHRLTAAITVHMGANWELRMDNEARIQAANALRTSGGDHALLSSLALVWRPGFRPGMECALQVDNLWNSGFQEVPAVPAARRQIAVSVAHTW